MTKEKSYMLFNKEFIKFKWSIQSTCLVKSKRVLSYEKFRSIEWKEVIEDYKKFTGQMYTTSVRSNFTTHTSNIFIKNLLIITYFLQTITLNNFFVYRGHCNWSCCDSTPVMSSMGTISHLQQRNNRAGFG